MLYSYCKGTWQLFPSHRQKEFMKLIGMTFFQLLKDALVNKYSATPHLLGDLATVYLNKGECDLNQSKVDPFVKRVAKNNS